MPGLRASIAKSRLALFCETCGATSGIARPRPLARIEILPTAGPRRSRHILAVYQHMLTTHHDPGSDEGKHTCSTGHAIPSRTSTLDRYSRSRWLTPAPSRYGGASPVGLRASVSRPLLVAHRRRHHCAADDQV